MSDETIKAALYRTKREGERMRVARYLRDHGQVRAALMVQGMSDFDPAPPQPDAVPPAKESARCLCDFSDCERCGQGRAPGEGEP